MSPVTERCHEAHELEHHDERPRRRLRHTETIEHLAGFEPAIGVDSLLRHVGQRCIRSPNVTMAIFEKKTAIWLNT